ncbi:hypothetical protein SAMN06265827_105122 [Orenia metallireducens]|uniref:Uncharacterized protein n=1 Tax=Orenia metallireducens TaxID=1413210 RepID=A0A285G7X6_9FIRM|nr:hypothetical protein [Orenia metallireducens]SNY19443.1 hypothetical protein SAMN06265827_105122 [Orenia metallireducens]
MGEPYDQTLHTDGDGKEMSTIGQTVNEGPRAGKDDFIAICANYERDLTTGLYFPPGYLPDDRVAKPRVKSELQDESGATLGTDSNPMKVSQSGSKVLNKVRVESQTDNISSSTVTTEDLRIFSEAGYFEKIFNSLLYVASPSNATSGTHSLEVLYYNSKQVYIGKINANYNENIWWTKGLLKSGSFEEAGMTQELFRENLRSVVLDQNEGHLALQYTNNTDGTQSNRTYRLAVKKEGVS